MASKNTNIKSTKTTYPGLSEDTLFSFADVPCCTSGNFPPAELNIPDGCAYCNENTNGLCYKYKRSKKIKTITAEPMPGMDRPLSFPLKCLTDCFGDNLLFCNNCHITFSPELGLQCKYCSSDLVTFNTKSKPSEVLKTAFYAVEADKDKYSYTSDPDYGDFGGFDAHERAFLQSGGSLYAVDFGIKRGCEYCIETYGECARAEKYCFNKESYVEFNVNGTLYIEEVPDLCAAKKDVNKSLCRKCNIIVKRHQERCPVCFNRMMPVSRLRKFITNRIK